MEKITEQSFYKKITKEFAYNALLEDNRWFRFIKNQTKDLCKLALAENPNSIYKNGGYNLQYVKKQTKELCLLALSNFGLAIKWVKKPTKEMYITAVNNNGYALRHIDTVDMDIILAAINQNGDSVRFINKEFLEKNKEEICLLAIKSNCAILRYLPFQNAEIVYNSIDYLLRIHSLSAINDTKEAVIVELIYFLLEINPSLVSGLSHHKSYYDYLDFVLRNNIKVLFEIYDRFEYDNVDFICTFIEHNNISTKNINSKKLDNLIKITKNFNISDKTQFHNLANNQVHNQVHEDFIKNYIYNCLY